MMESGEFCHLTFVVILMNYSRSGFDNKTAWSSLEKRIREAPSQIIRSFVTVFADVTPHHFKWQNLPRGVEVRV